MKLTRQIEQCYFDNLDKLTDGKKFHLASRLYGWSGNENAAAILNQMGPSLKPAATEDGIGQMVSSLLTDDPSPRNTINAKETRQKYFDTYPELRGINRVLFRVRHLLTIYDDDIRQPVLAILNQAKLDQMAERLYADDEAIRVLSTYAINFLYIYKDVLQGKPGFVDLGHILNLAEGYDLSDKTSLQLYIYLFTHCIIGETNFYTRPFPDNKLERAKQMLSQMEAVIKSNFVSINLDNKLEFLVCCRICGYKTDLFEDIYEECDKSVSPGGFLVDTHNNNPQPTKMDLVASEHRNVLYLMSCSEYQPHGALA